VLGVPPVFGRFSAPCNATAVNLLGALPVFGVKVGAHFRIFLSESAQLATRVPLAEAPAIIR
jgi:hypothetical protein